MELDIRWIGLDGSDYLKEHVVRRVGDALSSYAATPACVVTVRVSDINGPRGGRDKSCLISLTGPDAVQVEAVEDDAYAAIDHACRRLTSAVSRRRGRRRASQRPRAIAWG